jgi:hypothetical protein
MQARAKYGSVSWIPSRQADSPARARERFKELVLNALVAEKLALKERLRTSPRTRALQSPRQSPQFQASDRDPHGRRRRHGGSGRRATRA